MALSAPPDGSDQRLDEHAPGAGAAAWRSEVAALRDEDQTPLVQFLLRVIDEQAQRLEQQAQRLAALEAERAGRQRPRSTLGQRCRDTFLSWKATCQKLGVRFVSYLQDRLTQVGKLLSLPELVRTKAASPVPISPR